MQPRRFLSVVDEDGELVASDSCDGIGGTYARAQAISGCDQHLVTARVAERVVHVLEAVEIAEHHSDAAGRRRAACECVLDAIAEQHPVREAGEGVVEGVVDELDLVRPKSRDGVSASGW